MNSFNNCISGIAIQARRRDLRDGPWCVTNGFIEQLSVQAVDCSIFLISFTLFHIVTRSPSILSRPPLRLTLLLVAAPWVLPLITSIIALTKHFVHPVSGNWCWIQERPRYLRYALTHGWRFLIIILVVVMGIYTRVYVKRHPVKLQGSQEHIVSQPEQQQVRGSLDIEVLPPEKQDGHEPVSEQEDLRESHDSALAASELQKVMLLSSYPVYYIILWIPGIANRLVEAIVGQAPRWLTILQASTQFVGLANAVTFGWNEVRDKFSLERLLEMLLGFVLGS
jgi:hypothetical protein